MQWLCSYSRCYELREPADPILFTVVIKCLDALGAVLVSLLEDAGQLIVTINQINLIHTHVLVESRLFVLLKMRKLLSLVGPIRKQ